MNKLYIIAGIVVVGVALYFILFMQSTSFDDGLKQINSFWEKQGIAQASLSSPLNVYAVDEQKLVLLQSDLENFSSSIEKEPDSNDKEKLLLLAETQSDLISTALLEKKNFGLISVFESSDYDPIVLCSSINQVQELYSNMVKQKQMAESFNAKVASFSEAFPAEAEKSGISQVYLEPNSNQGLADMQSAVTSLQGVC